MVSTRNRAGWPARSIAARIDGMSVVTPVEVSLCTTQTALIAWPRVRAQPLLDLGRSCAVAPVAGHEVDDELQPLGELLPQRRELAGLGHQHAIAGRQRVDQRRFPRAGAARGIDDDVLFGLEHLLHAGEHGLAELAELGAAMVDRRMVDRAQHAVGHVGRPGNLQEVATGGMAVEFEHGGWPGWPDLVYKTHPNQILQLAASNADVR